MSKTIGQAQKELDQKELKVLRDQLEEDSLKTFDVRDYVFRQVMKEAKHKKAEKQKNFEQDKDIYNKKYNNLLVKTAIGKKWAKTFNYDYDAAYISNLVYKSIIFPSGKIEQLDKGYEYVIACDGRYFRGDTMNSWSRTLNEFVRVYGSSFVQGWNGRKIPEGYDSWEEFLSVPDNYIKEFPSYIMEFMQVVYTIGNFIPVPLTPSFNTCRNSICSDYWDLTLLAIYRYYEEQNEGNSDGWKKLFAHDGVEHWLGRYGGWKAFVEGNILQAFVEEDYGPPKPLWEGHFNFASPYTPKTTEQFKAFFTNAAEWIKCRGEAMAEALCNCKNTNGDGLLL